MRIDQKLTAAGLAAHAENVIQVAAEASRRLESRWSTADGAPVFTINGVYTSRGWTDWTRGFQFGIPLLVAEATGDESTLAGARLNIHSHMPLHLTHMGVHDHGFNTVSTYGNLLRLVRLGLCPEAERPVCELALRVSGSVQASRWTDLPDGLGYVHSFNGPHSLFADTIRSMRVLALAHLLRHHLFGEQDTEVSLLERLLVHAETTAQFNVYFGEGRDEYDEPGRVAHESIFNTASGSYRNPSTQQGYSPFTTWTRGQAWILLGFAELLEFVGTLPGDHTWPERPYTSRPEALARFESVARVVAEHYIRNSTRDGIPYWDTGAPGLVHLGAFKDRDSDPFNRYEPVDSSAAAIAALGLLRLGHYLGNKSDARRYLQAGLTVARTLFGERYLSEEPSHEGVLLHSVYHRPNGWDHVQPDHTVPHGEATMWGDYHGVELALCVQRIAAGSLPRFFNIPGVGT